MEASGQLHALAALTVGKERSRDFDCKVERWMELAQDCVQWRTLVLVVLKLRVQ